MGITKYFKSIKGYLFHLSGFICFSEGVESPFEGYTNQDFFDIIKEGGQDGVVNKAIDFYMDKNGKLTEKGENLKAVLAENLTRMYGGKNPKFKDIGLKDLIQAAVIGFSEKEQDPGTNQNINGTTVYYKEYITDNSKPLVIWLHGNGCSYDSWPWDPDNPNYKLLQNVLAIEYPSYVKNSCSTFEEIDKYTTAVAEFLEQYIKAKQPNKRVILFSHSFGCNANTLVYVKLKKIMNNLDLRSILIFPYYSAIDASVNVLKNVKKLGVGRTSDPTDASGPIVGVLDNFLPPDLNGKNVIANFLGGDPSFIIKDFVFQMYKRMFENNKKNESQTELEYIDSVSNNAFVLSKGGVKLKDIRLIKYNVDHCAWNYGIDLISGTLGDILKGNKDFIVNGQDKNVIIVFSEKDDVVGKGGFLIANHFVNDHVGHNTKTLFENNSKNLKQLYKFADYDIKPNEIKYLKDEIKKLKHFDFTTLDEIRKQGMCQCCNRIKKEEENGIKDAAGDYIDRKNNN